MNEPVSIAMPLSAKPHRRDLGFIAVLSAITLSLYAFYWIPKLGEELNTVLGKKKYKFWVVLVVGILTVGIGLCVYECCYAYDLQRHSAYQRLPNAKRNLGGFVVTLDIIAVLMSLLTAGIAGIISLVIGVWATWLIQDAMNQLSAEPEPAVLPAATN
ncbi:MAG TPA: DUF4234 domain-containing protein [Chthoniobacteraceae bacterium]|nr:DUF4234 domain-containing protein [Chthoniobacteraceae bacterium]